MRGPIWAPGRGSMLPSILRAAFTAIMVIGATWSAAAADKAFQRDDLADSAIRLEARIKADAGNISKTAAVLKREADQAFARNDIRVGMQVLSQLAVVTPNDSANWLRLARAIIQIWAPTE